MKTRNLELALLNAMQFGKPLYNGSKNNYEQNVIDYIIGEKGVLVSTACRNDYGRVICNNDLTFVPKASLPNWVARKLYL